MTETAHFASWLLCLRYANKALVSSRCIIRPHFHGTKFQTLFTPSKAVSTCLTTETASLYLSGGRPNFINFAPCSFLPSRCLGSLLLAQSPARLVQCVRRVYEGRFLPRYQSRIHWRNDPLKRARLHPNSRLILHLDGRIIHLQRLFQKQVSEALQGVPRTRQAW